MNEWISVTDRLPASTSDVLAVRGTEQVLEICFYLSPSEAASESWEDEEGNQASAGWYSSDGYNQERSDQFLSERVTHWLELPELPA